jgi:mono/diheme cytochrome c family protein
MAQLGLTPISLQRTTTRMSLTSHVMLFAAALGAQCALAADEENGKRLAQQHCSPCHVVEPGSRRELANSPPFETIARKFASAPELIAFAILSPHPRMNLTPSRRDAQDIAAYIATLAKD